MTRLWPMILLSLLITSLAFLPVRGQEEKAAAKAVEKGKEHLISGSDEMYSRLR